MTTRITLENVRITFPKIFPGDEEAYKGKGDPFWSGNFLMAKDHPDLKKIGGAIVAAATKKWGEKAMEKIAAAKAKDKLPVHSGDLKAGEAYGAAYKDMLYLSARTNAKKNPAPGVFDNVIDPATGEAKVLKASDGRIYSGCFVNVMLDLFGYENEGSGIGASIAGVQFHADGERLAGGSAAAATDFKAVPAAAAPMPGSPVAPATGAASLFG